MSYSTTVGTDTQVFSGKKLERRRHAKRLTQHDLASRIRARGFGTTQATVSRWESKGHQPHAAVLPALAEELDCLIGDFYGAEDDDEEEEDAPLSRDEMDLYLSLHARVQRQVQRVAGLEAPR